MPSEIVNSDEVSKIWDESPHLIRGFLQVQPQYEQLCSEIAYILQKRLKESSIEYSAVTNRAKTLKSFAEKLTRKQYDEPLKEITDLAGVRIVYLYKSDRAAIENIVEAEFKVLEKVDKVEGLESDKFGYGALHYLVHLGRKTSGARYDDLKNLICEIQVRTVLQDAWAIIDHHLVYKNESDVPKIIKRKLNSLSGLFETADDQFDRVRYEREQYKEAVKKKLSSPGRPLEQELNLDSIIEYLKFRFPDKKVANSDTVLSENLAAAMKYGYTRLSDIDALFERTESARTAINSEKLSPSAAAELARAVALENPEYRRLPSWNKVVIPLIEKYESLLSKE